MNIIVSACLLGVACRYDGLAKMDGNVCKLVGKYNIIPVCPEILGGLATPRCPSEIVKNKVITKLGADVTENYWRGANEVLKLARLFNCKYAILKERSPSCGYGTIYDGSFNGKLIEGNGITAQLLYDNDIQVLGESQIDNIFIVNYLYL